MKVIKAPNNYIPAAGSNSVKVFLAGGLQKCDWQTAFFNEFEDLVKPADPIVIFNPRRDDYDLGNGAMEMEQITWEFKYLNKFADDPNYIFSMYFDDSESPQPICFYELGRYLTKVAPENCIVTVNPNFFRRNDVRIQTFLATNGKVPVVLGSPRDHANRVFDRFIQLTDVKF